MIDILLDAFLDSVKIWPLLFLIYLVFEYIGNKRSDLLKGKTLGPVVGALSGCIPQCGASVAAAGLYASRAITIGTLFAVFISTSDEAIPLLMMYPEQWSTVGGLLIAKVVLASVIGVSIDFVLRNYNRQSIKQGRMQEEIKSACSNNTCENHCCQSQTSIFKKSFSRSLKVILFLFGMSIIIGLLIEYIGEETLEKMLLTNSVLQPAIAAFIGLIPNCVSSVLLTELFLEGMISLGSVLAGLCTGAGVGILILFKLNRPMSQNFKIIIGLYSIGVVVGISLNYLMSVLNV